MEGRLFDEFGLHAVRLDTTHEQEIVAHRRLAGELFTEENMTESMLSNLHQGETAFTWRRAEKPRRFRGVLVDRRSLASILNRGVSAVVVLPTGYAQRLSSVSAANAHKTLEGVHQENPAQIQALLQRAPHLITLLAQAVRGLRAEFGGAPFRLRANDNSLVLAVQTYDEVKDSIQKLEAFEDVFWATKSDSESLLTLTVDFLTRSEQ